MYFIVDGADDNIGKLYLGNTLIADGSGMTDISLDEVGGINIGAMNDGDVLMYDMSTGEWKNVSLASEIGDLIKVFTGASEREDGTTGLVPQPLSDDFDKFLRGDGSWADPTAEVKESLEELERSVSTLIGNDNGVSVRLIARSEAENAASAAVADLVANADSSFDTLKEIADWILTHPEAEEFVALANRVTSLDNLLNGTDGTEGLVAQVGTLSPIVGRLDTAVGNLEGKALKFAEDILDLNSALEAVNESLDSHNTRISDVENRLMWHELYEE